MKASFKRKINFLVAAAAFCAFLTNIILTAFLKETVLIWVIGAIVTLLAAYFFSGVFSRGIESEMQNFLGFTSHLGAADREKNMKTFYDVLFLQAAKNVDVYVQSIQHEVSGLKEKKGEVDASLKVLERCLADMKNM